MEVEAERVLIEMALNKKEWITVSKLSDKTDLSDNKIREAVTELVDTEHIKKYDIGPGSVYELTEKGKQEAENPSEDTIMMLLLEK